MRTCSLNLFSVTSFERRRGDKKGLRYAAWGKTGLNKHSLGDLKCFFGQSHSVKFPPVPVSSFLDAELPNVTQMPSDALRLIEAGSGFSR